jgi:hypothetical protein
MTPTTPQSSQDDIFFTPMAHRQSSIQPSSPSDQNWSDSDGGVNSAPRNTGGQEVNQEDPNDDLSWSSSPPTTGPTGDYLLFPNREAVKDHIQTFAAAEGWTVKASSPRKDKNGEYHIQYFACSKGGSKCVTKVTTPQRKRPKSRSGWCNCPWRAVCHHREEGWWLRVIVGHHRRHPRIALFAQATHRRRARLTQPRIIQTIQNNFISDNTAKKTLDILRRDFPDVPIELKDIYNEIQRHTMIADHGLPAINAMMKDLGQEYLHHYSIDSTDRLVNLIFFHKESVTILQRFYFAITLDCTYKTNRFNMYLLDIVGVTATGRSFVIGQAFLSGEHTEDYTFVLQWLQDLYREAGIEGGLPTSFTTDQAGGLLKALQEVFPEVPHLLCIWHINKRVTAWVTKHWLDEIIGPGPIQEGGEATTPEQRAELIKAKRLQFWPLWTAIWKTARSEADVEAAWQKLCGVYRAEYPHIISYLEETWMKHRKLFCRFWTDQVNHFNNDASNRAESCHQAVKKDLPTNMLHLRSVIKTLTLYLKRLNHSVLTDMEKDLHRPERQHTSNYMYGELIYQVSAYAINQLIDHLAFFKEKHSSALPPCTGRFTRIWGIPCAHKYYETKENGERLKPADFHKQWSIRRRDLPPLDPLLLVRDPLKIRDRPGKRQLSFFERIDIDLTTATTHASQKKKQAKLLQGKVTQFFKPPRTTIANNTFALSLSPKKKQLSYFRLQDKLQREPTSKEVLKHLVNLGIACEFGLAGDFLDIDGNCKFGTLSTGEYDKDLVSQKWRENDYPIPDEFADWDQCEINEEIRRRTYIHADESKADAEEMFNEWAIFSAQMAQREYWKTWHGITPLQWCKREREEGRDPLRRPARGTLHLLQYHDTVVLNKAVITKPPKKRKLQDDSRDSDDERGSGAYQGTRSQQRHKPGPSTGFSNSAAGR